MSDNEKRYLQLILIEVRATRKRLDEVDDKLDEKVSRAHSRIGRLEGRVSKGEVAAERIRTKVALASSAVSAFVAGAIAYLTKS